MKRFLLLLLLASPTAADERQTVAFAADPPRAINDERAGGFPDKIRSEAIIPTAEAVGTLEKKANVDDEITEWRSVTYVKPKNAEAVTGVENYMPLNGLTPTFLVYDFQIDFFGTAPDDPTTYNFKCRIDFPSTFDGEADDQFIEIQWDAHAGEYNVSYRFRTFTGLYEEDTQRPIKSYELVSWYPSVWALTDVPYVDHGADLFRTDANGDWVFTSCYVHLIDMYLPPPPPEE